MIPTTQINRLLNTPSIEELWDMHTKSMAEYGFDRLIYGYTRYRTATSLGDPEDFVLLTNHKPDYTDGFIGNGLFFHAPMVRWALEHDGSKILVFVSDNSRKSSWLLNVIKIAV